MSHLYGGRAMNYRDANGLVHSRMPMTQVRLYDELMVGVASVAKVIVPGPLIEDGCCFFHSTGQPTNDPVTCLDCLAQAEEAR